MLHSSRMLCTQMSVTPSNLPKYNEVDSPCQNTLAKPPQPKKNRNMSRQKSMIDHPLTINDHHGHRRPPFIEHLVAQQLTTINTTNNNNAHNHLNHHHTLMNNNNNNKKMDAKQRRRLKRLIIQSYPSTNIFHQNLLMCKVIGEPQLYPLLTATTSPRQSITTTNNNPTTTIINHHHSFHNNDDDDDVIVPFTHKALRGRRIVDMCCGMNYSMLCLDDGSVWGFGENLRYQMSVTRSTEKRLRKILGLEGLDVIKVRAKGEYSVFVTRDGRAFACGSNDWQNCGYHGESKMPKQIMVPDSNDESGENCVFITDAQCGYGHGFLLDGARGVAYSFGGKSFCQLGREDYDRLVGEVKVPDHVRIEKIVCGTAHSFFICVDRDVCSGDDSSSSSSASSRGRGDNSRHQYVYVCGKNNTGNLATGHLNHVLRPELLDTSQFKPYFKNEFLAIDAGRGHSAFLTDTYDLFICGDNTESQTNFTSSESLFSRVQHINPLIPDLNGSRITSLACAYQATIFCTEGAEKAWGMGVKHFCCGNHSTPRTDHPQLYSISTKFMKHDPKKQSIRMIAGEAPLLVLLEDKYVFMRAFPRLLDVMKLEIFQDVTIFTSS